MFAVMLTGVNDLSAQRGKKNKAPLKMAKKHLQYEEYEEAIPFVQELLNRDDQNAYYNFWMGKCLYLTYKKNKALPYMDKVNKINPDVDKDFHYLYGLTLHYNDRLEEAIAEYRKDQIQFEPDDARYRILTNRISQASYAKQFQGRKDSKLVKINNMGESINSEYAEHSPVISADNTLLMYTARRPDSKGADAENHYYDEDIYISRKQGDSWSSGENIGTPVNSKGHDATISLTADAKTLYMYRHKKAGGLYRTDFDESGNEWKEPRSVEKPLNSKYYEASICQSADSNLLFFSSERPGGYGGLDIYMVERDGKNWGEPQNLGPRINSPFNEDAPFIHPDGITLYFSSDGGTSIGGYDIFVTEFDSSSDAWLEPLNMGPPVNSADDEIYFVISSDGLTGYFASGREGGFGEKDIYEAKFPYFRYPKRFYAMQIAGMIQDANSLDTVASSIKLIDKSTGEVVDEMATTDGSGKYRFMVEPERSYSLQVDAEGYDPVTEDFTTPGLIDDDISLERNIFVSRNKIEIPPPVVSTPVLPEIQHIYFDFDKTNLRKEAKQELEVVASILSTNKQLSVVVAGHTDWYGTYDYNSELSNNRSKAAIDYLESLGVNRSRIQETYFSENQPLEENGDDLGRQYNRRCEFRFVQSNGTIAFSSMQLHKGAEAPRVDHTTPKGAPGFDNPGATSVGSGGFSPADEPPPTPETDSGDEVFVNSESDRNDFEDPEPPGPGYVASNLPAGLENLDLHHIYFDFDKSYLRKSSMDQLQKVIDALRANPDLVLHIKGHTDTYGSTNYNQRLSENRSHAAFEYIEAQGISDSRVVVKGFSELQPIAANDNSSGRQANRRVEFEIRDGNRILMRSSP